MGVGGNGIEPNPIAIMPKTTLLMMFFNLYYMFRIFYELQYILIDYMYQIIRTLMEVVE